MPRIPTNEQNVMVQPVQPTGVPNELYTGGWKNATEMFGALDESVKKIENLRDENDVLKSSTDLKIELSSIENEADKDGDPKNVGMYKEKIDKAISKHLEGISAPQLRNKNSHSFSLSGYTTYSNIQSKFNKQVIEQAQDNLYKNIEVNRQAYIGTTIPAKKDEAYASAMTSIDNGMASGYLTAENAKKLREEVTTDWMVGEATFDAQNNPDMFITEATKPDGKFANIDAETKVKLLDYADKRKEKIIKQQEDELIRKNNQIKADQLAMGDDLTPDDVKTAIANKVYKDPTEAEKFMNFAINGVQVDAKTDSGVYTSLMNDLYSLGTRGNKDKEITKTSKNAADINEFRIKARQANLDKKLSDVDYKDFIDGTQKVFDEAARKEVEKQKGGWQNFLNWLNMWSDTFDGDVNAKKAEYLSEFNKRTILGGEKPEIVTDDIKLRSANEKYSWLAGKKIGDTITNKFGKKRIYKGIDQNGNPVLAEIK